MRFMILVHATEESEAGVMPSTELLTEMGRYNEELVDAGVMQAGEGLHPSSRGVRVRFSGDRRTVVDGPFAETKELIAGYWIWETDSLQSAIEWVKRCPNPHEGESVIEIRRIFEADEFGEEFTPEARAQEEKLRADAAAAGADGGRETGRTRKVIVLHRTAPWAEEMAPDEQLLTAMGNYMAELVKEGLLVEAEGLHPSRAGARVHFSGSKRTVMDGPFTEAKELVAGFTVLRVRSMEEAIEWVKRCPMPANLPEGVQPELEVRPVFGPDDFGEAFTPELREQEERLRARSTTRGQPS